MPKIRTTFTPWKEIDVPDDEAAQLRRMGRVVDTSATTEAGLLKAAERQNAGQQFDDSDDNQEG